MNEKVSVALAELAVDLRLKYKIDTEMQRGKKYPLTVFRSCNASTIKIQHDEFNDIYNIAIVKAHPKDCDNIDEYTDYQKGLTRGEVVVTIVRVLGL